MPRPWTPTWRISPLFIHFGLWATPSNVKGSLLARLKGPFEVPGTKSRLVACKAGALPTALLSSPENWPFVSPNCLERSNQVSSYPRFFCSLKVSVCVGRHKILTAKDGSVGVRRVLFLPQIPTSAPSGILPGTTQPRGSISLCSPRPCTQSWSDRPCCVHLPLPHPHQAQNSICCQIPGLEIMRQIVPCR